MQGNYDIDHQYEMKCPNPSEGRAVNGGLENKSKTDFKSFKD